MAVEPCAPQQGPTERLRYTYFLHYAEGLAMPLLVMKLVFTKLPGQVPLLRPDLAAMISKAAARSFIDPQLEDHIAFWESELARRGHFAGADFGRGHCDELPGGGSHVTDRTKDGAARPPSVVISRRSAPGRPISAPWRAAAPTAMPRPEVPICGLCNCSRNLRGPRERFASMKCFKRKET